MKVWLDLPDRLAEQFTRNGQGLPRAALEALAVDAYRMDRLSGVELCDLLNLPSRADLDAFLKTHGVPLDYSIEDFEHESETSNHLWEKRQAERPALPHLPSRAE